MEAELFMSSLGFLKVNPAEDWYDFLVKPQLLLDFFAKVQTPAKIPGGVSVEAVLSQLVEKANQEEKEIFQDEQAKISASEETELEEIQDQITHRHNKSRQLRMLAFACCAQMDWNLDALSRCMTISTSKSLLDRLLWCVVDLEFPQPPEMILNQFKEEAGLRSAGDHSLFLLIVYCRWCLMTDVAERFPKPPPKLTVSNPVMQTDPGLMLMEEKRIVLDSVRKMSESAVTLLERWLVVAGRKADLALPDVACFLSKSDDRVPLYPHFSVENSKKCSVELLSGQIRYDLLAFYFAEKKYAEARRHLEGLLPVLKELSSQEGGGWTVDGGRVEGYCLALNVRGSEAEISGKPSPGAGLLGDELSDSLDQKGPSLVTRMNLLSQRHISGSERSRVGARSALKQMEEFLAVSRRCLHFLTEEDEMAGFCEGLMRRVNRLASTSDAGALTMYLKLMCRVRPELEFHLKKSGVSLALGSFSHQFATPKATAKLGHWLKPDKDAVARFACNGDSLWCLTRSLDMIELKKILPALQPFRLPIRLRVPSTLDHLCNRLPPGYIQDIIGLFSSKTEQMAGVGNVEKAQSLVQACMLELGPPAKDPVVHAAFNCEGLKMELESWQRILHRKADVRQVGQVTGALVPKVKGYVGALERMSRGASTSTEMGALTAAFLLNSCDWEYYLKIEINPNDRVMNLAKMIAAMCHELSQGNASALKLCTRTFFDLLLPTVEKQSNQTKRKAGGDKHYQVQRQFVTRHQFTSLLTLVKEQRATSLLIGYFGKLFNVMSGGMKQIFTEHSDLWPSTYTESSSLNEDFVRESLDICVANGLLINPNNAFCLRTKADLLLANGKYFSAMQYYAQTLCACSDYFTKSLPENVVNDSMFRSMMKCCRKLGCQTEEALLAQCLSETKEAFSMATKALEESNPLDALDTYYAFVWQMNFYELYIHVLSKRGDYLKVDLCKRHLGITEFNSHNRPEITDQAVQQRKVKFFTSLCQRYLHHY